MEKTIQSNSNWTVNAGGAVLLFWLVVSVIFVWFIAKALYKSWDKTYQDNLTLTMDEVCGQHDGYSYWSQTDPDNPKETPRPIFKCVLD